MLIMHLIGVVCSAYDEEYKTSFILLAFAGWTAYLI